MNRRGILRCAAAAVLFGASTPAASKLAGRMNAFTLAGLLYVGAALAVLPVVAVVARPAREAVRRGLPRLAVAVVAGGAIGPVLLALGLQRTPAATASLLLNLELVFTALVAAVVFAEYLGRWVLGGMGLVVAAGALLGSSGTAGLRWGALLVVGACACWAVDNSVTANLTELAPAHITLAKGLVAGSVNLVIGLASGVPAGWPVLGALLVGAVGYGASITLWVSGARDLGAARGQLVFAGAPFVGALISWTVLGEPASWRQIAALAVAATGVGLVLRSGHEHEHMHTPLMHDHEHVHRASGADEHHTHEHPDGFAGRHHHVHEHVPLVHAHPHVPDLHHRHRHE
jgi:drug/metabolite transporter (DMT)-like permease